MKKCCKKTRQQSCCARPEQTAQSAQDDAHRPKEPRQEPDGQEQHDRQYHQEDGRVVQRRPQPGKDRQILGNRGGPVGKRLGRRVDERATAGFGCVCGSGLGLGSQMVLAPARQRGRAGRSHSGGGCGGWLGLPWLFHFHLVRLFGHILGCDPEGLSQDVLFRSNK